MIRSNLNSPAPSEFAEFRLYTSTTTANPLERKPADSDHDGQRPLTASAALLY